MNVKDVWCSYKNVVVNGSKWRYLALSDPLMFRFYKDFYYIYDIKNHFRLSHQYE